MNYPELVDAKDVRFMDIKEVFRNDQLFLHLRGLVFHSALAVKAVEIQQDDGLPVVMVRLTPAARGLSGSFVVEVPLRASGSIVKFGPLKTKIWPSE